MQTANRLRWGGEGLRVAGAPGWCGEKLNEGMEPRGDRWSHAPPIPKPNGQRMTPPIRPAWWSWERKARERENRNKGRGRRKGSEFDGNDRAHSKTEWPAHDSTDAP